MTKIVLILGLLLLPGGLAWSQGTEVTASVDSDAIGVHDQVQLTITVSGEGSGDAVPPRIPNLQGLRVVAGPSINTQFQWVNGRTAGSRSFIYTLVPEKEGQFTIEPVEVRIADKIFKTQPLPVRVTSAARSLPSPRGPSAGLDPFEPDRAPGIPPDAVFVRAELDRNSAYPGQQVTLSYHVWTRIGISRFQLQESPALSGFWVEELEVEREPKPVQETYNGRTYLVFTAKKQALFATAPGKLRIPASVFAISTEARGGLFGVFGRTETLYRTSQELALDVKPFPTEGRPANFKNAVGSFRLTAKTDRAQATAGEAAALRVELSGEGNLKMIPDIPVAAPPGLTVYPSRRTDEIRPSAAGRIGGKKTWEFVIVPKAPGSHTIAPIAFSYFNPLEGKFETVATQPVSIEAALGTDSGAPAELSGSGKQELVRRGTDINFIKLSPGSLEPVSVPFFRNPWYYAIAAVPLLLNLGIIAYRRRNSRTDPELLRIRSARRNALRRLKTAEKVRHRDARRFYDEVAAALSGFLIERFGLAEIELTGDRLERVLSSRAVPQGIIEETKACLRECDFGRFVSPSSSADGTGHLLRRIRENVDVLSTPSTTHGRTHETE